MKILEQKLDFDNVLLVPQFNNIHSRSEISLIRNFKFKNSQTWSGVPIIAANMTTVASFKMATKLAEHHMMTALHKFYSKEELIEFYNLGIAYDNCWYTVGSSEEELNKLIAVNNHKRCM